MNKLSFLETENHGSTTDYLQGSIYCDLNTPTIVHTAKQITGSAITEQEKAVRLFNWVRDNIRYHVGLHPHSASETFVHRYGSCTNKANLLVAMLRAIGIPAAFRLYRVKTREYFGPLCSKRLTQFMSLESIHVFAAVNLNHRWLRIDPTDDYKISEGGDHLNPQCIQAKFNGQDEALLNIEQDHIVYETENNMHNVDEILQKETRLSTEILWVMNSYLNYIRSHGKFLTSIPLFEESFFTWLELTHPKEYEKFCIFEGLCQDKIVIHEERMTVTNSGELN